MFVHLYQKEKKQTNTAMHNTLTQKFTAYEQYPFVQTIGMKTMDSEDYMMLVHMVKMDLDLELVPEHVGKGMLEELSAIMN